jgi:hypothetical protein
MWVRLNRGRLDLFVDNFNNVIVVTFNFDHVVNDGGN